MAPFSTTTRTRASPHRCIAQPRLLCLLLALALPCFLVLVAVHHAATRVSPTSLSGSLYNRLSGLAPRGIRILNIVYDKMDFGGEQGLYQLSAVRNAIYAKLHGYSYVLVEDEEAKGQRGCWAKVGNLASVVKEFELVVYMDFDVYLNNMTVPLEQLLQGWGFTQDHDLLMALDPDKPYNRFRLPNGTEVVNLNVGFIVVRNTPGMVALLDEWYRYKESGRDDQRAFNIHIRRQVPAGKLLVLPCSEANGGDPAWNQDDPSCKGIHIQHAWHGKGYVETRVRDHLLEDVLLTVPMARRRGIGSIGDRDGVMV